MIALEDEGGHHLRKVHQRFGFRKEIPLKYSVMYGNWKHFGDRGAWKKIGYEALSHDWYTPSLEFPRTSWKIKKPENYRTWNNKALLFDTSIKSIPKVFNQPPGSHQQKQLFNSADATAVCSTSLDVSNKSPAAFVCGFQLHGVLWAPSQPVPPVRYWQHQGPLGDYRGPIYSDCINMY